MAEERTPQSPPLIAPLPDHEGRPLWSVMIPAYNCITYLRSTLESVLKQDPGPDRMQIEVVDDGSTDGDVEGLVNELGKGRIGYFRQKTNRGSLRNFETCLNRSRGQWIHMLHGDDMVKPGFYRETEHLLHAYPEAAAAFTGVRYIDEQGKDLYGHELVSDKEGIVEDWLSKIAQAQWLQPPAIVVKRTVYEQLGGFFAVHYGEDWEMWIRIAANFPVAFSPKYLAAYRVHTNNISSRSLVTGQNIKDLNTVIKIAHCSWADRVTALWAAASGPCSQDQSKRGSGKGSRARKLNRATISLNPLMHISESGSNTTFVRSTMASLCWF